MIGTPPLWIRNCAARILADWPAWEDEAGQEAQQEQNADAGEWIMLRRIENAIAIAANERLAEAEAELRQAKKLMAAYLAAPTLGGHCSVFRAFLARKEQP